MSPRPLAISVLLGASGWFAGLFLLAFVGMLFQPDSAPQAALCGTVLMAAAWGLFRVDRDGTQLFVSQIALALSIAGQCLLLYALSERAHGIAAIATAAVPLQAALALLMPNRLHRTLSTLFAAIAWALALQFALWGEPSWSARHATRTASIAAALGGWLLTWVPVGAGLVALIRSEADWTARGWASVLRPVLTGLIIGVAFAPLASQPFESARWLFGGGGEQAGGLALWPLLSALAALGAVAAAFAVRRRALMGVCVAAVLLHVAQFYYVLGTGLLAKSVLLLAMGGAFLLAARALNRKDAR